jgi:hypothetical protein
MAERGERARSGKELHLATLSDLGIENLRRGQSPGLHHATPEAVMFKSCSVQLFSFPIWASTRRSPTAGSRSRVFTAWALAGERWFLFGTRRSLTFRSEVSAGSSCSSLSSRQIQGCRFTTFEAVRVRSDGPLAFSGKLRGEWRERQKSVCSVTSSTESRAKCLVSFGHKVTRMRFTAPTSVSI